MYDKLKEITEEIYRKYAFASSNFEQQFFPYIKLVRSCGNYQYHFLVVKKDYVNYGDWNKTLGISMHLFLHPFFEAYRGKGNISNVNARYYDKEVIFICKDCLEILKS